MFTAEDRPDLFKQQDPGKGDVGETVDVWIRTCSLGTWKCWENPKHHGWSSGSLLSKLVWVVHLIFRQTHMSTFLLQEWTNDSMEWKPKQWGNNIFGIPCRRIWTRASWTSDAQSISYPRWILLALTVRFLYRKNLQCLFQAPHVFFHKFTAQIVDYFHLFPGSPSPMFSSQDRCCSWSSPPIHYQIYAHTPTSIPRFSGCQLQVFRKNTSWMSSWVILYLIYPWYLKLCHWWTGTSLKASFGDYSSLDSPSLTSHTCKHQIWDCHKQQPLFWAFSIRFSTPLQMNHFTMIL